MLVSISIFQAFWSQLGWILAPKLEPNKVVPPRLFRKTRLRGAQVASKRPQERSKSAQERPKSAQERPKATQERPESDQNMPGGHPRCFQRGTFSCISSFFCSFLYFSAFFYAFLRFFAFLCVFMRFQRQSQSRSQRPTPNGVSQEHPRV